MGKIARRYKVIMHVRDFRGKITGIKQIFREVYISSSSYLPKDCTVKMYLLPFHTGANAFTIIKRKDNKKQVYIFLNLLKLLAQDMGREKQKLFLCSILHHEFKHILIHEDEFTSVSGDFNSLMILFEKISQKSLSVLSLMADFRHNSSLRNSYYSCRYYSSTIELSCILHGLDLTLSSYDQTLSVDELKSITTIRDAVFLSMNCLTIIYVARDKPVNRWKYYVHRISKALIETPELFSTYPLIRTIFHSNGKIKSALEIYDSMEASLRDLYDKLLCMTFLSDSTDYTDTFSRRKDFKAYIEGLMGALSADIAYYLENLNLLGVILPKELIQDNTAMVLKFAGYLNTKIERYGFAYSAENVFVL